MIQSVKAAFCVVLLAVVSFAAAGCGGSGVSETDSSQLAATVGALSCTAEAYYLENRIDHTKARVYSCDMGVREKCVTDEGGIARDVTAEAKLLFASTLGSDKPLCLSS